MGGPFAPDAIRQRLPTPPTLFLCLCLRASFVSVTCCSGWKQVQAPSTVPHLAYLTNGKAKGPTDRNQPVRRMRCPREPTAKYCLMTDLPSTCRHPTGLPTVLYQPTPRTCRVKHDMRGQVNDQWERQKREMGTPQSSLSRPCRARPPWTTRTH